MIETLTTSTLIGSDYILAIIFAIFTIVLLFMADRAQNTSVAVLSSLLCLMFLTLSLISWLVPVTSDTPLAIQTYEQQYVMTEELI